MTHYPVRYAFRLDNPTEAALEQISRHTFQSKASLMRRYVQEGVKKDAERYAEGAASVMSATNILARV